MTAWLQKVARHPRAPLDTLASPLEPLRIVGPVMLEGGPFRPRSIPGGAFPGFAAFLDGIQRSEVLTYRAGVPIVHAVVAAAVRVRRDRRMTTWAHAVDRAVYAPRARLPLHVWDELHGEGSLVDSTPRGLESAAAHPWELVEAAIAAVQRRRDSIERELAARWRASERSPLYVDGPVTGRPETNGSEFVVGVVKSHRTLYAPPDGVDAILALRAGERSPAFLVVPGPAAGDRIPVASWYLRMREPLDAEPFWGLVRVEVPVASIATDRADLVSRWILAEAAPVALPDSRWATLAYGVRDCEEFLRAIV